VSHPIVGAVRAALKAAADPAKAPQMQAYMKSEMPYRGVSSPGQRRIWRSVCAEHPIATPGELREAALELWRGARFREERYAAIGITDLRRYAAWRDFSALPMFEEMIVTGAWWDFVDPIATHHVGDILRKDPRRMKPMVRRWAKAADSMWKRRAAILSQIGFKGDTDLDLLYDCIEPNIPHKNFFIRKAIGWALRQHAWTDPREVKRYVGTNRARLSPLSVREALKNI
jgi:3-methyladenine DNA glycosylase AlkD